MRYQLRHSPNTVERYTADERSPSRGVGYPRAASRAGSLTLTVFPLTWIVGVPKPL